jgi:hypothetical protein
MLCEVIVVAKDDCYNRENTVDLGIKESLSQRDLEGRN